ncbi:MAG: universal stress protein, partial [Longimicrobiales bacterium]
MPIAYREVLVPVDNSPLSDAAVERAIELARASGGRITATHVYAARLHDIRFRQLEIGLPARFQAPAEIKRQRKIHDKLIEKGLQLISDSFLDDVDRRCTAAGVPLTRQLLEGINYQEIAREANSGAGRLPSLIGFDPNIADKYDGSERVRGDVRVDDDGRLVAEDEVLEDKLAGSSEREYDLVAIGAHGLGQQALSQLGSVVARAVRVIERDVLIVKRDAPLQGGRVMVCVDGSSYAYRGMRIALELCREFNATLYVCSAFDVEYHHVVFNNIKDVLSVQAAKVFKFEEQEELHNNIIDRGLLKLAQANLKRAQVMASEYPDVDLVPQILVGKPFQCIQQWIEEVQPTLLVCARHGAHRIEDTEMGSQADNLTRQAACDVLLIGTADVRADDIPWIEEDGRQGLEWAPEAEVRIQRVPPFALGIARMAVEEYVLEHHGPGSVAAAGVGGDTKDRTGRLTDADGTMLGAYAPGDLPTVTNERLDEAISKLLPTHMQLIMGIGTAEELAAAELKAQEAMRRTVVSGSDEDPAPADAAVETRCPVTGRVALRERTAADPPVWTNEAFDRLRNVPLIARPLARNTVEKFARGHDIWRITTVVMDENKQKMIDADEFDRDTMLVMFRELQTKQIKAAAEGVDGLTPEMRRFIEEAKAAGVTRCPIRDIDAAAEKCPVDFATVSPADARR